MLGGDEENSSGDSLHTNKIMGEKKNIAIEARENDVVPYKNNNKI